MTTMKTAEEFKREALQAIKDLGGFPYIPDIYWSYRAVKDIPVWKEQYFHPSIDAVPVVRCKDCKHLHLEKGICTCVFSVPSGPDGYCSYGEIKEERK